MGLYNQGKVQVLRTLTKKSGEFLVSSGKLDLKLIKNYYKKYRYINVEKEFLDQEKCQR